MTGDLDAWGPKVWIGPYQTHNSYQEAFMG